MRRRTKQPDHGFDPRQDTGAAISRCGNYRYALWRTWNRSHPRVVFVCLNPSTADSSRDDPTLRRCMDYATRWGFGGVVTANLFAWRATDPRELKRVADPVGPCNDRWLIRLTHAAPMVVAAWGDGGGYLDRADSVRRRIHDLLCLRITARGQPAHPLYLPRHLTPCPFSPE